MKWLERGAQASAVLAGVLLTFITLMTCGSLLGRNTIGVTLVGDFELSGAAAGAAIALFLPWCQWKRGNIIVDFFTSRATARTQAGMDRVGAALLAAVMALLAWRTAIGGINAWQSNNGSMILGFPEWITYAVMVPPLVLTGLIGAVQAVRGFAHLDGEDGA